ncbi:MAG: YtxH domain-containing protein [Ferruginibacter sp.]
MSSSKLLTGILVGAAAGAVLGILFAPDKGSETRKKIKEKGKDLGDAIRNRFGELEEAIADKYDNIRSEANELMEKGKDKAQEARRSLS